MAEIYCATADIHNLKKNTKFKKNVHFNNDNSIIKKQGNCVNVNSNDNIHEKFTEKLQINAPVIISKKDAEKSKNSQIVDQDIPPSLKCEEAEGEVEGSLPLHQWTKLAQQTGTRPAVDKYTLARYNPLEWHLNNESLEVKELINDAKDIAFNVRLAETEIYTQIDKNTLENDIHLKKRARLIYIWKRELEHNNEQTITEIENINKIIKELQQSNRAIQRIKNINSDIQQVRNLRLEADLVHDSASEELIKEDALCKEILNLYSRINTEGHHYLQELKSAKQRVEHDWSNKTDAYNIDVTCIGLKKTSPEIQWKPGCTQLPDGQFSPEGYDEVSKESIIFNQTAITRARVFCLNVKDMIDKVVKDLKFQASKVNIALKNKIHDTQLARKKLEDNLVECLITLADTERIAKTSQSIRKLDFSMKCAQSRLGTRLNRPKIEHCRDIAQYSLINEVKDISEGVAALSTQMKNGEDLLETLKKSREKIEKNIMIKQRTLWVDQERCQLMRSFYPTDQELYGY